MISLAGHRYQDGKDRINNVLENHNQHLHKKSVANLNCGTKVIQRYKDTANNAHNED